MEKITLQEAFKEYELMTVSECLKQLKWKTEFDINKNGKTGKIICECGEMVKTGGWIGTEHAWCPKCHKGMQDMTCLLPNSNSSATYIDQDKVIIPEDGRVWTPKNIWGH